MEIYCQGEIDHFVCSDLFYFRALENQHRAAGNMWCNEKKLLCKRSMLNRFFDAFYRTERVVPYQRLSRFQLLVLAVFTTSNEGNS